MKTVFMTLDGPLETDARVLRSIEAALLAKLHVIILTCNTKEGYSYSSDVEIVNLPFAVIGGKMYAKFCIACLKYYLANKERIDIVYLHDYFSTLVGVFLKPFCKGKRLVYDAHELILPTPGENVSLRDKIFLWAESKLINRADLIIQANKEREDIFKKKYSTAKTSNVLNITRFKNIEKRQLNKEDVVIVYQGNITEERKLSFFIDAMLKIKDVKLLFIGSGHALKSYQEKVHKMGLDDRISFTGRLSNEEMMQRMRSCSIGIISYPFTNLNNIYCSPNKIFEYAAISLPFIATAQPFIKQVQDKYNIGRTFEFENVESFVDNVNKIIADYSSYNKNTDKFLSDYNYENELNKLTRIFQTL